MKNALPRVFTYEPENGETGTRVRLVDNLPHVLVGGHWRRADVIARKQMGLTGSAVYVTRFADGNPLNLAWTNISATKRTNTGLRGVTQRETSKGLSFDVSLYWRGAKRHVGTYASMADAEPAKHAAQARLEVLAALPHVLDSDYTRAARDTPAARELFNVLNCTAT
jgi:hypothetical protein